MPVKERVEFLLKQTGLSQSDFAAKSGYSRAVLSNFLTGKTDKPRIDFLDAIKRAFPTLDLNWLITGEGDMWKGPPPSNLKDIPAPPSDSTTRTLPEEQFFNRLLVQKLEEAAEELKKSNPEAYRRLKLEELIRKEKK